MVQHVDSKIVNSDAARPATESGELRNAAVNLVMLTTESSPNMKERGKAAGVKGWIVKPFNGPAVLETFKKLVA
jgi:two-component system chemotaxis response regulator CheY